LIWLSYNGFSGQVTTGLLAPVVAVNLRAML